MPVARSIVEKILLAFASVILFIAISEAAIRWLKIDTYFQNRFFIVNRDLDYPDVFQRDRFLFWKPRPSRTVTSQFFDGRTYSFNSIGLRGSAMDTVKRQPRIVALGNSCTFGWGVGDDNIFTAKLEQYLNHSYEVINAGIPGYSSYQGKIFFESEIKKLKPDILLILFAWNDQWPAANRIPDKNQKFPPEFIIDAQNLLSNLHLYRLLKKGLLSTIEDSPDSLFNKSEPVYRVELKDFYENLSNICSEAKKIGAVPILLTSPIPSFEKYTIPGSHSFLHIHHEKYNDVIRTLATKENIKLADLAREFDKYDFLFDDAGYDPVHFNALGHQIAAELIARLIKSLQN